MWAADSPQKRKRPLLGLLAYLVGLCLLLPGCLFTIGPVMPTLSDAKQDIDESSLYAMFAMGVILMISGTVALKVGEKLSTGE